jgi:hypothetical protein
MTALAGLGLSLSREMIHMAESAAASSVDLAVASEASPAKITRAAVAGVGIGNSASTSYSADRYHHLSRGYSLHQ